MVCGSSKCNRFWWRIEERTSGRAEWASGHNKRNHDGSPKRSTAWKEVVAVEKIFEKTHNRVGKVEEAIGEHAKEIQPMKKILPKWILVDDRKNYEEQKSDGNWCGRKMQRTMATIVLTLNGWGGLGQKGSHWWGNHLFRFEKKNSSHEDGDHDEGRTRRQGR